MQAHMEKEGIQTELGQSKNKLFILQEKRITNEADIRYDSFSNQTLKQLLLRSLSSELTKLDKRIEHFDYSIKKLNITLAEERENMVELDQERAAKSEGTFAR